MSETTVVGTGQRCAPHDSPAENIAPPPTETPPNARLDFEGQVFFLPDGSRWRLLSPLSKVKLQQANTPCEGTQVFTCVNMNDSDEYGPEVVVKIKFQYGPLRASFHSC
jgi:hypothetical protein